MKRVIALSVLALFVLALAAPVFALPAPVEKFKGGIESLVKSPIELPKSTIDEVKNTKGVEYKPIGFMAGLMKGTYNTAHHAIKGALDVVTFPLK